MVSDELKEKEEKAKHQNNIIFFKVDESNENLEDQRQVQDFEKCQEIIKATKTENIEIVKIKHLCVKLSGKERPIMIEMCEAVLRNAKNLKHSSNWIKMISIMKDMTSRERAKHKEAMKELREKRSKGKRGWFVRDGKLFQNFFRSNY